MSSKTDLRKEYDKLRSSGELAKHCGTTCANCGSSENIEYHHIVPLILGGTNSFGNIAALCHKCHKAAHGGHHVSHYADTSNSGRKSKVPDEDAFKVYDLWLDGQIGNMKCKEMLNLSSTTQPNATIQYKRWLRSRGIEEVRNNFDAIAVLSPFSMKNGKVVGWYKMNGKKHNIYFKNTGANDTVYKFRNTELPEMTIDEIQESQSIQPKAVSGSKKAKEEGKTITPYRTWWSKYRKKLKEEANAV